MSSTTSPVLQPPNDTVPRSRFLVVAICFAAIVFDGYDLIIFGSTAPSLLAYEAWSLTPGEVGAIASYALLGMMFGALASGPLTDRFGRRRLFIGCLTLYSVMMIVAALAPNPAILGIARFIAGLGFGGVAPVAIALVVEVARAHERHRLNAIMLTGLPVGGVIASLVAMALIDDLGFRGLWALGGLGLVTVVPLAWFFIPETAPTQNLSPAQKRTPLKHLADRKAVMALALFAVANFAGFLLVFGLNTWLPELMRGAGYDLGSALTFQLLLNLGAVVGGLIGSALADRFGVHRIAPTAFAIAIAAVALMAANPPAAILGIAAVAAGAGSIGTQIIVFGYVATYFEAEVRGTALGLTTGIGRLGAVCGPAVAGFLLGSGLGGTWIFGFFGAIALLGGISCLAIPRSRARTVAPTPRSPVDPPVAAE